MNAICTLQVQVGAAGTPHVHRMHTTCIHYMYTTGALHVHYMYTTCTLQAHYMYTTCALLVHYIYTACTLQAHARLHLRVSRPLWRRLSLSSSLPRVHQVRHRTSPRPAGCTARDDRGRRPANRRSRRVARSDTDGIRTHLAISLQT